MKKLYVVFALILMSVTLNAQLSQLDISTYYNTAFDLYLDGELLINNVMEVSITDIAPGPHILQLKKVNAYNGNAFGNLQKPAISLFKGTINIPANILMTALVFQGQLLIQNQIALVSVQTITNYYGNNSPYTNIQGYYSNQGSPYNNLNPSQGNSYGQNANYMPGMNTHWNVLPPQAVPAGPIVHQPVYNYGPQAMSPENFQLLKASIEKQWFSSGQMEVVNQALATNYFTSSQARELVELFTFSSDQLLVAKKAYTKTIDPQNYFVVNDALEFSSYVSALSAYIASQ